MSTVTKQAFIVNDCRICILLQYRRRATYLYSHGWPRTKVPHNVLHCNMYHTKHLSLQQIRSEFMIENVLLESSGQKLCCMVAIPDFFYYWMRFVKPFSTLFGRVRIRLTTFSATFDECWSAKSRIIVGKTFYEVLKEIWIRRQERNGVNAKDV